MPLPPAEFDPAIAADLSLSALHGDLALKPRGWWLSLVRPRLPHRRWHSRRSQNGGKHKLAKVRNEPCALADFRNTCTSPQATISLPGQRQHNHGRNSNRRGKGEGEEAVEKGRLGPARAGPPNTCTGARPPELALVDQEQRSQRCLPVPRFRGARPLLILERTPPDPFALREWPERSEDDANQCGCGKGNRNGQPRKS